MATTVQRTGDAEYQTGTAVRTNANPRTLPNIPPRQRSSRFVLAHHPNRWTHGEDGWYPTFARAQARPGSNGVTSTADGQIDATAYEVGLAREGFQVIQPGDPRLPEDLRWYCTRLEMRDGGATYLTPWEQVGVINGRTRKRRDDEMHQRFWMTCLAEGIIRPMSVETLGDQLSIIDNRISGLAVDRSGGVNITAQIERANAKREKMVADWQRQFGDDTEAEPKPERKPIPRVTRKRSK